MSEWNELILTPKEFHDKAIKLAEMIPKGKYKYVYGIPRGGWVVAVYLSHYCDLGICNMSFLNDKNNVKEIIIADDVSDTGKTLENFKEFDIATIHYKPKSTVKPTYYVDLCENNVWIRYPYEKKEEVPNREV